MLYLPRERVNIRAHREQSQLSDCITRPRARLTLAVTLQEEAKGTLCGRSLLSVPLSWHHHNLPGQVTDVARRRQHRVLQLAEIGHAKLEGGLGAGLVLLHFGVLRHHLWVVLRPEDYFTVGRLVDLTVIYIEYVRQDASVY